jgi:hypothetical protein
LASDADCRGALNESACRILSSLPDDFGAEELAEALEKAKMGFESDAEYEETKENLLAVAHGTLPFRDSSTLRRRTNTAARKVNT